jgi:hypothetical protein
MMHRRLLLLVAVGTLVARPLSGGAWVWSSRALRGCGGRAAPCEFCQFAPVVPSVIIAAPAPSRP